MRSAFLAAAALFASPLAAGEVELELALEGRAFLDSPPAVEQHGSNGALSVAAEWYADLPDGHSRLVFSPFLRLDGGDPERTHFDLREFYWRQSSGGFDLYIGLRRIFWGVTEALHLIDVINQTDLVENLDGEDRLGQPLLQLAWHADWGDIDLFLLPGFRERTFPGRKGRLRTLIPVNTDRVVYEAAAEAKHIDWAVRYFKILGPLELGLAHFTGTLREPTLSLEFDPTRQQFDLIPSYELGDRTSIDVALVVDAWLWKLEALSLRRNAGRSTAFTGGFEYTWVGPLTWPLDLGFIAEYQYDDRGLEEAVFQNDLAVGVRFGFHDAASTELLLLAGIDLDGGGRIVSLEGARRLGESWRLSVEARLFQASKPRDGLFGLRQDDYLQLTLTKFY